MIRAPVQALVFDKMKDMSSILTGRKEEKIRPGCK